MTDDAPGARLLDDIRGQPESLRALAAELVAFERVAREAVRRGLTTVRLVGHGSSDNAASYAVYAFGLLPGWTAFRDTISLHVYYDAHVDLRGSCVLALSQSGRTPDVVRYVERARSRGALTIALTNEVGSPLAEAAEAVLPLAAGAETSIAATKTYTAQIAAGALLAACAAGQGAAFADGIGAVADRMAELLPTLERSAAEVAAALAGAQRLFVIGRGPEFATARELSLKLLETCRVGAQALTTTDLVHGPVAAAGEQFPVWAVAADDPTLPAVREAVARAVAAGAPVVVTGTVTDLPGAAHRIPLPHAPLPLLAPLLSILPGQLFARALALEKGLDPDQPAGITKVTLAP